MLDSKEHRQGVFRLNDLVPDKNRMQVPRVAILILNWNGWKDTIVCLESVFRGEYNNYQVIVCDNDSHDGSIEQIVDWANGNISALPESSLAAILRNVSPAIGKPIPYRLYDCCQTRRFGDVEENGKPLLIIIKIGSNLGFAGGNNVGLRYILDRGEYEYVWLLNNDTIVEKDALAQLVIKMEYYNTNGRKVGIVGSKLLYYDKPGVIQGVGGIYNKWFGTGKHIGLLELDNGQYDNDTVIDNIDYVIGAAMFVSKRFLHDVGLMCEDYFLYYEEVDWSLRSRKLYYSLGYSWNSIVYHKEGGTTGSNSMLKKKSELSDYYTIRNRILLTKKFFPSCLWSVYLGFLIVGLNRIRRGQIKRLRLIWRILVETFFVSFEDKRSK